MGGHHCDHDVAEAFYLAKVGVRVRLPMVAPMERNEKDGPSPACKAVAPRADMGSIPYLSTISFVKHVVYAGLVLMAA